MTRNFRVYGYLRASTKEQDAARAKDSLLQFATNSNLTVATFFIENESSATLDRPELFRLLDVAQPNDIILVEQIDRISRLNDRVLILSQPSSTKLGLNRILFLITPKTICNNLRIMATMITLAGFPLLESF